MALVSFSAPGNGASPLPEAAPGIVHAAEQAAATSGRALHPALTAESPSKDEGQGAASGLVAQAAGAIASAERRLFRGGGGGSGK